MTDARRKSAVALTNAIESTVHDAAGVDSNRTQALGSEIESALFALNDGSVNRPALREKLLNIKHNPLLAEKLASGVLSPEQFARMSNEEMARPDMQQEIREIKKENLTNSVITEDLLPRRPSINEADYDADEASAVVSDGIEYEKP